MNNKNYELKAKIIKRFGSQLKFAETIGVRELVVSQVINGRRKLNPKEQKKWSAALG